MIPPALFFFLKIVLATQNLLWFHTNFRHICSTSVKKKKNAIFIMNGCWILSDTFLYRDLCVIFFFFWFFILLIQGIMLIFWNVEPSLHPWNKSHLIVVYDPFMYCWFSLLIFCWGFLLSMFIRNISLWFNLAGGVLVWF